MKALKNLFMVYNQEMFISAKLEKFGVRELGSKFSIEKHVFLSHSCANALWHTWHLAPTFPVCPGPRGFLGCGLSVLKPGQS